MKVLVIAPHPDDEACGVGGTIAKHVADGDRVEVLYVTSGEKGVPNIFMRMQELVPGRANWSDAQKATACREQEADWSSQCLNTHKLHFMQLPDGDVKNAIAPLTLTLNSNEFLSFDRWYAPSINDAHPDHIAVSSVVRNLNINMERWYYEVWSPLATTDINEVVDISTYAGQKRGAINAYKSQQDNGFAEAMLALNHYRGLFLGPRKMYCEVFSHQ